jgi:hypothetical protein
MFVYRLAILVEVIGFSVAAWVANGGNFRAAMVLSFGSFALSALLRLADSYLPEDEDEQDCDDAKNCEMDDDTRRNELHRMAKRSLDD